jgi:hypothetical protein
MELEYIVNKVGPRNSYEFLYKAAARPNLTLSYYGN